HQSPHVRLHHAIERSLSVGTDPFSRMNRPERACCYSGTVDRHLFRIKTFGMPVLESQDFDAFYLARSRWLIGALRPIVGHDAEDVAQDAFATLYQRWDVVSQYDSPEGWLKKIAVRAALRHRQRTASRP